MGVVERIAFVQVPEEGQPYSVNGAAEARGFEKLGYQIHFFRRAERRRLREATSGSRRSRRAPLLPLPARATPA